MATTAAYRGDFMDYVDIAGMKLSRIILGTDGYSERIDEKTAPKLMETYVSMGGNVIDTARSYCGGKSEELVGRFVQGKRDKIIISTKCAHPPADNMKHSRLDRESIEADIDASLKALGTDYIDIIWLHRDDVSLPVMPIIDTLNLMKKKGKVRFFGASNWTYDRIAEANSYAAESGQEGFFASQALYNLATRTRVWDETLVCVEGEEKKKYEVGKLPLFAFSSQAKGFFEKYDEGTLSEKAKDRYLNEASIEMYKKIKESAEKSGDTISHAALKMLVESSGFEVFPIIGPSNVYQLKATFGIKA